MKFNNTSILYFLWMVPIVGGIIFYGFAQKKKALLQFASRNLIEYLAGEIANSRICVKCLSIMLALAFMIMALACPMWGTRFKKLVLKDLDLIIVLDISPSMLARDVSPNRLELAKQKIVQLLEKMSGARAGLVVFSGISIVRCPLTFDLDAVRQLVESVNTDMISHKGTNLGPALENALNCFDNNSERERVIALFSDGEDNEHSAITAARKVGKKNIRIFAVGIGSSLGAPIPAKNSKEKFRKDSHGNLIITRLNETLLRKIARISGGTYVHTAKNSPHIEIVHNKSMKNFLSHSTRKTGRVKVQEKHFTSFLLISFLFLFLDALLPVRERRRYEGFY